MIRLDIEQGSEAWLLARLGIPTASRFDSIITPKTMKASSSSDKYAWQLIAERVLGRPVDDASSAFMARGTILETKAVQFYELARDVETTKVGFILRDDRRAGCSPDRLVGNDGLLEIKVPNVQNHIGYLLDAEGIDYRCQVQGQLWITEREWCDTESYNPEFPPALVRVWRDEKFITALAAAVDIFNENMDRMIASLQSRYPDVFGELAIGTAKVA